MNENPKARGFPGGRVRLVSDQPSYLIFLLRPAGVKRLILQGDNYSRERIRVARVLARPLRSSLTLQLSCLPD